MELQPLQRTALAGDEILGALHDNAHFFKILVLQFSCAAGVENPLCRYRPDSWHPEQFLQGGCVDLYREKFRVFQCPTAFGVYQGIEIGVILVQQFLCAEAVETQQPVRLVQAVLPQQRRLCIQCGQKGIFYNGHIGGVKYPF